MTQSRTVLTPPTIFAFFAFLVSGVSLYVAVYLNQTISVGEALTEEQRALLTVKQEILDRFIGIFLTVVSVLSAFTAILGVGLYAILKDKVERDVDLLIKRKVSVAQAWAICATYNEAAFAQWREYEECVQHVLVKTQAGVPIKDLQSTVDKGLDCIGIAEDMIKSGRDTISELQPAEYKEYISEKSRLKAYVNLLNGSIYATAARAVLLNKKPAPTLMEQVDADIERLLEFALGRLLAKENYRWWESIETIGFYQYHVGRISHDIERQKKGSDLLVGLEEGQPFKTYLSPVPENIRHQVRTEYTNRKFTLSD